VRPLKTNVCFSWLLTLAFFRIWHKIIDWIFTTDYISIKNKDNRAQRALGRSPEEKVKGHCGANNREPQGHNFNNFGRGPFDDVIY